MNRKAALKATALTLAPFALLATMWIHILAPLIIIGVVAMVLVWIAFYDMLDPK